MLAQTGGNDPDSQNLFAQTQPETSEMSTQTESLVENLSTSMLNMLVRDGSEEGQEHKIVQSEMSQPAQDDAKSGEEETYATNLWQDLQQTIEQDCLTEGQKQIETICLPSQNGIAGYQIRQIERAVETVCTQSQIGSIETQVTEDFRLRRHLSEAVSEQRTAIENVLIRNVVESFVLPGADITAAAYSNQEEGGQDNPDIPDQEAGSSELLYVDYEELP